MNASNRFPTPGFTSHMNSAALDSMLIPSTTLSRIFAAADGPNWQSKVGRKFSPKTLCGFTRKFLKEQNRIELAPHSTQNHCWIELRIVVSKQYMF